MASSLWQWPSSLWGATSWAQRCDSSCRARAISSLTLAWGRERRVRAAQSPAARPTPESLSSPWLASRPTLSLPERPS